MGFAFEFRFVVVSFPSYGDERRKKSIHPIHSLNILSRIQLLWYNSTKLNGLSENWKQSCCSWNSGNLDKLGNCDKRVSEKKRESKVGAALTALITVKLSTRFTCLYSIVEHDRTRTKACGIATRDLSSSTRGNYLFETLCDRSSRKRPLLVHHYWWFTENER